ncbi:MAG: hypothetical protein HZB16_00510, partial [Armatimonadetes bacterium]|nr:hypothetical protein [Armatimonadota bacterium]
MVPSRRSALWGALFVALACRWAAAETLDVKIVAGPASPQPALIGETVSAGLTAIVTGAPTANAELLIVGPEWTWTAGTPSLSGAAAMLTSQGPAAILSLQSAAHGTASVPVTVTCSYSDPATGKAWSGSDSTTVSAVFTELVDVTVSGAQHKVYEDASEVWGVPRRPDTEQAPAPKVGLIAVFEPSISATDAERLLSWSGGEAGADVLSRLVPTTAAGLYA